MANKRVGKRVSRPRKVRNDGWTNLLVGLGKSADKTVNTELDVYTFLEDQQLGNLYMGEGLGRTIIDAVADDMTREWITIENDDEGKIMSSLKKIKSPSIINAALKWKRLFGGSLVIIGAMDGGDLSEPLRENRIKSIDYLKAIDRTEVYLETSEFEEDPMKPEFGQIKVYDIRFGIYHQQLRVHRSRVLEFFGGLVPSSNNIASDQELRYWGSSALQPVFDFLRDLGGVNQGISNIMYEFIIGKYKLAGLANMFAQGNEQAIIDRMEIINMYKSVINAVILDETEDYTRDSASVTGLAELLDRKMMFLSGVCGIPLTRLFGRSPAGFNATGESDLTTYYDKIAAAQTNELESQLQRLVDLISVVENTGGNNAIKFNPLYQLTEKEQAEVDKLNAETDQIRIEQGVYDAEYVQKMRYPDMASEDLMSGPLESEE